MENYLDVYLRTPGLEKEDVSRALVARGEARRLAGEKLLLKANSGVSSDLSVYISFKLMRLDFQSAAKLEPSNRDIQAHIRKDNLVSNAPLLDLCPFRGVILIIGLFKSRP